MLICVISWDHAGGVLIYEEAGGKVTDLDGKAIDFSTGRKMSASKYFGVHLL
jgi:3'(2'), 5'-bisphosphate nucleotidase